ncbi:MAG: bifunctional diguanylate cyclase/phosphohydrolase [Gaiellaceae bacterium]
MANPMQMRRPLSQHVPRASGGILLGLFGLFLLYVALVAVESGEQSTPVRWLYNLLLVGSAVVCLKAPNQRGPERAAWRCLGVTLLLWAAGDLYYTLFLVGQSPSPPTMTDALWLVSYPVLYVSIGLLVRARTPRFEQSLWLDAVLAALAVAAIGAAVLFGAVVDSTGGSPLTAAMNLAYPLADALLLGLVVAVLALTGWRLDRTWICILAGTGVLALADSAYLYQSAIASSTTAAILDAAWPLAMVLLAAAAWQPAGRLGAVRTEGGRLLALPAVFGTASLAILVYGQFGRLNTPAVALAATSLVAVIARMAYTFREKMELLRRTRIEALTDALTSVGNRRKLMDDLHERLESGDAAVLMLLDLDGFKAYNDTFGHPAGDALLARIAQKLTGAVSSSGEVYRIGGDEFCVLASVDAAERESFAAAAASALEEQGEGFRITAAYGVLGLPEEAASVSEALRIVDGRMYDEKDGRRASAGRQSRDVLLRVLYERDARLQGHLNGLAELVRAVGMSIGLTDAELEDVALAAELHEVGKLAIPDSILRKPGPLSEDEWRFVRRHPLIGERILSSAPALAKVSKIVRSTHERIDGDGYPDQLAGDAIPLGARIVGACAAFVAMTSDLPYRAARSAEEAIEELQRCAGTQFDADVVEALVLAQAGEHADLALLA